MSKPEDVKVKVEEKDVSPEDAGGEDGEQDVKEFTAATGFTTSGGRRTSRQHVFTAGAHPAPMPRTTWNPPAPPCASTTS
jgi:hypothetical protein